MGIVNKESNVDTKTIDATLSGFLLYLSAKIKLNTAEGIEYWIIKTFISKLSILKKPQITELITNPYASLMQLIIISLFIFIIFVSASL